MSASGSGQVRVGLVVGQLTQGGAERQLYELALRLPHHGYMPTVFCLSQAEDPYGPLLRSAGIQVHCLPRRGSFELRRARLLARALRHENIQLAHAFLFVGNLYCHFAARRAGVQAFLPSVRSLEFTRPWLFRRLDQRVFSRARLILVNSPSLGMQLRQAYRIDAQKLRVVPNGLDLGRFPDPAEAAARPAGPPVIGSVSLFKKEKRIPMILEMAAALSRQGSDAIFRLVGDGPERRDMLALRDSMGLAEMVEMPGASRHIPEDLAGFDIFLLASEREGMPNAILEAMAAKRPVVASRVTGTVDVVRHGSTGLLFDPTSVEDAVATLKRLLDDEVLRRQMGREARRVAESHYSAEAMVGGTIDVYRELGMKAA